MKTEHIVPSAMTEKLMWQKVVRIDQEEGVKGTIVGVAPKQNILSVLWAGTTEPATVRRTELKLVLKDPFRKKLSWHGNTFGELAEFVQQAQREGVLPSAMLNDNESGTHVHINVPLPLATAGEGDVELSADGVVIKNVKGSD